ATPAAAVRPRGGDRAVLEGECDLSVGRLHAHGPGSVEGDEVASGVDEARADIAEKVGRAVDGVSLGDAAEVEPEAGLELDRPPLDADSASARLCRNRGTVAGQVLEGAVVAGGDERIVHRGVEQPTGALP